MKATTQTQTEIFRQRAAAADLTPTWLRTGDIIDMGEGGKHLCWRVNDCRALCLPLQDADIQFTPRLGDDMVEFATGGRPISISPNSPYPIVKRLGEKGMLAFLEQQKQERKERNMAKNADKTTKTKEPKGPRLGRLGGFLGHSTTSVIRAMAVLGWEFWECRMVFDEEKIPVSDNTIRIQLSAGRRKEGGDPAPVSKELKGLRPDPADKPERKGAKPAKPEKKDKSTKSTKSTKNDKPKKARPAVEEDDDEDEAPARKSKDEDEDETQADDGGE